MRSKTPPALTDMSVRCSILSLFLHYEKVYSATLLGNPQLPRGVAEDRCREKGDFARY
jgi:hypothetical protein